MRKRLLPLASTVLLAIDPFTGEGAERLVPSQYPTIQAAVNAAASGDTIRIAAGEYREQAYVHSKQLSIVGDPGAVLHAHSEMTAAPWNQNRTILGFERANVVVSNLVLEGNLQGDYYGNGSFFGVVFRSSSGRLDNCTIRGFRATSELQVRAVNVNNLLNSPTHVTVTGCTFSDNYLSLVFFGNDTDPTFLLSTFNVQSNTFTGLGADAPFPVVGIWISYGAAGTVTGNTLKDYIFNGEYSSVAIVGQDGRYDVRGYFIALRPLVFNANTFINNSIHLALHTANNTTITNNVFGPLSKGALESALVVSGTNVVISDNNFADATEAIRLLGRGDTQDGVPRGIARNVTLARNWFSNVATTLRTNDLVTFEETGTQLGSFQPSIESMKLGNGKAKFVIRALQGKPLAIESSSELNQWTVIHVNSPTLPVSEHEIPIPSDVGPGFFRLWQNIAGLRGE